MKIVITGICGYIGSHLCEVLDNHGYELIGVDKKVAGTGRNRINKIIQCDLSKQNIDDYGLGNIDLIIHLAGESSVNAENSKHKNDTVAATRNLLNSELMKSVKKVILLSSNKADDGSAYGNSKASAERALMESSEKNKYTYTVLRSAIVYGKGMKSNILKWVAMIKNYPVPRMPKTDSCIEMIGIDDLCNSIHECIKNNKTDNQTYTVCDGFCYKINDLERKVRKILGKNPNPLPFPRLGLYLVAKVGDFLALFKVKFPMTSGAYDMFFRNSCIKSGTFSADTGFKPKQNFYAELPGIME